MGEIGRFRARMLWGERGPETSTFRRGIYYSYALETNDSRLASLFAS
jgi:hypothetical protein